MSADIEITSQCQKQTTESIRYKSRTNLKEQRQTLYPLAHFPMYNFCIPYEWMV